jgi:hypothetical protein
MVLGLRRKKAPSEVGLRVLFWVCMTIAVSCLPMIVLTIIGYTENHVPQVTVHHIPTASWFGTYWFVWAIAYLTGSFTGLWAARQRTKFHRTVLSGVVKDTSIESDRGYHMYAHVEGANRAGKTIVEKVSIGPKRWRNLNDGDAYPWTS